MKCSMGEVEKTVRGLISLSIIAYGHYYRHYSEHWSNVIFWGGMYLAFTAVFAWCPIRRMFGTRELPDTVPSTPPQSHA